MQLDDQLRPVAAAFASAREHRRLMQKGGVVERLMTNLSAPIQRKTIAMAMRIAPIPTRSACAMQVRSRGKS
jgi:hypothetical protein